MPKEKPAEYIFTAGLAPRTISATAHARLGGEAVPPSSVGTSRRHHSLSTQVLYDFWNDSGMVTEPSVGSSTGGVRSDSSSESPMGPSASSATWCSTSRAVSTSMSSNGAVPSTSPRSSTSKSMNSMSRTLLR